MNVDSFKFFIVQANSFVCLLVKIYYAREGKMVIEAFHFCIEIIASTHQMWLLVNRHPKVQFFDPILFFWEL